MPKNGQKATLKHNASGKHIQKNNNLVTIIMNDRNKNRTLNFSKANIRSSTHPKEAHPPQQYICSKCKL